MSKLFIKEKEELLYTQIVVHQWQCSVPTALAYSEIAGTTITSLTHMSWDNG